MDNSTIIINVLTDKVRKLERDVERMCAAYDGAMDRVEGLMDSVDALIKERDDWQSTAENYHEWYLAECNKASALMVERNEWKRSFESIVSGE